MAGDGFVLWAFAYRQLPASPKGAYQSGGAVLRATAWTLIGFTSATILFWVLDPIMYEYGRDVGSVIASFLGIVVLLTFTFGLLFWISWTYDRYAAKAYPGRVSLLVMGITFLLTAMILAAVNAESWYGFDDESAYDLVKSVVGLLRALATMAFGMLFIAYASHDQIRKAVAKK